MLEGYLCQVDQKPRRRKGKPSELENASIENSKTEIQRKNKKNKGQLLCGKTLNSSPPVDTSFTTMYGSFTSKNDQTMRLTILRKG